MFDLFAALLSLDLDTLRALAQENPTETLGGTAFFTLAIAAPLSRLL